MKKVVVINVAGKPLFLGIVKEVETQDYFGIEEITKSNQRAYELGHSNLLKEIVVMGEKIKKLEAEIKVLKGEE